MTHQERNSGGHAAQPKKSREQGDRAEATRQTWAYAACKNLGLSRQERAVLVFLAYRANHGDGTSYPSHSDIHENTGWGRTNIKKAIKDLRAKGLVQLVKSGRGGRLEYNNEYRVLGVHTKWVYERPLLLNGQTPPIERGQSPTIAKVNPRPPNGHSLTPQRAKSDQVTEFLTESVTECHNMVNEDSDTSTSAHAQDEGGEFIVSEDFEQRMVEKYEKVPEEIVYNEITKGQEHQHGRDNPPRTLRELEFYIQHKWLPKSYAFADYGVNVSNLPPAPDHEQPTTPRGRKPVTRTSEPPEAPPELSKYMLKKVARATEEVGDEEVSYVLQSALDGGLPNKFKDLHAYLLWWRQHFSGGLVNHTFPSGYLTEFYPERSSS